MVVVFLRVSGVPLVSPVETGKEEPKREGGKSEVERVELETRRRIEARLSAKKELQTKLRRESADKGKVQLIN